MASDHRQGDRDANAQQQAQIWCRGHTKRLACYYAGDALGDTGAQTGRRKDKHSGYLVVETHPHLANAVVVNLAPLATRHLPR